jgi:hypothetical protein
MNENEEIILESLHEFGEQDREDLEKTTKLPRSTIFDACDRLILKDKIIKYSQKRSSPKSKAHGRLRTIYNVV